MKKLLSSICLLAFLTAFSFNNASAQSPVSFGLRGGLNFANLNNVDDTDSRTGFMAGVYANISIPLSPISIQPEVLYTQKGFDASGTVFGQDINTTTKLDYIEIPVLAKFSFAPGPVTPHVYFGPYLGFNINAEVEAESGGQSGSENIKDSVKDTDFGVVVGGSIDISKFNFGVRYGAGLTKVAEDDSDGKNGVFTIVAGINF